MFKSINGGQVPQRATKYSAGFDVFANEDTVIDAGETKLIGLGICLDQNAYLNVKGKNNKLKYVLDIGLYFELHPRSSLRLKGLGGGIGIIDVDYTQEIKMVITNPFDRQARYTVNKGDKIGQLIYKRHEGWLLPDEYTKDEERTGGFGSTDQ